MSFLQVYCSRSWTWHACRAGKLRFQNPVSSLPKHFLAILALFSWVSTAPAATRYVDLNNSSPAAPYTNWVTAATLIQDAIDEAVPGDLILVTNGVYQTGARALYGSNRVAVTKPVTVESVNGPAVTHIVGYQVPGVTNGPAAVRCVYLTNGAVLAGFTLTHGAVQDYGYGNDVNGSGGGVLCESTNARLSNCVLAVNAAYFYGGGVFKGTLDNCALLGNTAGQGGAACSSVLNDCTLTDNSANYGGGAISSSLHSCALTGNSAFWNGGGAYDCTLTNCTMTGNSASGGGGAYDSALNNCIAYFNASRMRGDNYEGGNLNYSCTTPLPTYGAGNISTNPKLASTSRLSADSPCRNAGTAAYASGLDIDGEPWANPPSIGCDDYWSGSVTGALSPSIVVAYTNVAVGFEADFKAAIEGRVSASRWKFGDGVMVSNQPYASHAWAAAGEYTVELRAYNESYTNGVAAVVKVLVQEAPTHYVALTSSNPLSPYHSWATAATNIQDAVDVAGLPGSQILVSNGVYQTGARAVYGSNRVAVTKPVTVQSANGPVVTHIVGYQVPGITNGPSAVRCVYLTNGAVLAGFTLTNGATQGSEEVERQSGGGVWSEPGRVSIRNCVLTGNSAITGGGAFRGTLCGCTLMNNSGGGVAFGTLDNCALTGNSASYGGGAIFGSLNDCTLTGNRATGNGGAAMGSTLRNCTLTANWAQDGGGAYAARLNNCSLSGNSASRNGGGAYDSTLDNCNVTRNSAEEGGGTYRGLINNCTVIENFASASGGGAYYGTLNNCIVYFNTARLQGSNYEMANLNYCCTMPSPAYGVGNITSDPQLASASHLSTNSPCRGAGSLGYASGMDIDGEPWAKPPSIGCDEYWSGSATGALSAGIVVAYTNMAVGFEVGFQASIDGRASASCWNFGDGVTVSNRPSVSHAWATEGEYLVELRAYNESHPDGVAAAVTVRVQTPPIHYVALTSTNPVPPYSSWAGAATNIQDAVEVVICPGALILVSNGVYQTGARAVFGSNRVAVTKPATVHSVNGPGVTHIVGYIPWGSTAEAVRCVYLTNGAILSGFTLTNGAARSGQSDPQASGGGVRCESSGAIVTNCVLGGNVAVSGGGASGGTLNNCVLVGNSADSRGGGAYYATVNNSTLILNSAFGEGGGAHSSTLNNCTLTDNAIYWNFGGGGTAYSALNNCIVYSNRGQNWTNGQVLEDNFYGGTFNYCCTTPPPPGIGNFSGDPKLVGPWGDLRLRFDSPCINTGNNAFAQGSTDLGGSKRISGGIVDVGAYEFQFVPAATNGPTAALGGAVAQEGEHACVPVYLGPSDELTGLALTVQFPAGFGNFSAVAVAPEINLGGIVWLAGDRALLTLKAREGQPLRGPKHLANLCFTLWTQRSAFLELQVVSVRGLGPDGPVLNNTLSGSGRVIAVGDEPLLEIANRAEGAGLIVYGKPGSSLQIEAAPIPHGNPQSWQPAFLAEIPSTTLWQDISLKLTNQAIFYRARRQ